MNKKELMRYFINKLNKSKLITVFIKNIFDYENFYDYNYLFRIKEDGNTIIIDIYDNISDNRFNRYIFSFDNGEYDIKIYEECNVFVSYIIINKIKNPNNKLLKFAYLFQLDKDEMLEYAKSFLDNDIILVLEKILKKPIFQ